MPIADEKKCQTFINKVAASAKAIQDAVAELKTLRLKFQQHNPDTAGTALEGNVPAVNGWINDADSVANAIVADAMIAARKLHHNGTALEVE